MKRGPWHLVASGNFQEAYDRYTELLKTDPSMQVLNGRGVTLLNMGRFSEACADFTLAAEQAWHQLGGSAGTCASLGTALWLMGDIQKAVEAWKAGLSAKYVDTAGGVELPALLLYAAAKTSDTDLEQFSLKLLEKRSGSPNWPGAIAGLYVGRLSPSAVRKAVSGGSLGVRERCQAEFHVGVYALKRGAPDLAQTYWLAAATAGPAARVEHEYYLARGEVGQDVARLSLFERAGIRFHAWNGYRALDRLGH